LENGTREPPASEVSQQCNKIRFATEETKVLEDGGKAVRDTPRYSEEMRLTLKRLPELE
jgi:hypothetical protein